MVAVAYATGREPFRSQTKRPATDDQRARKVRLLLLGKGVVSAHRIERPVAARLDGEAVG